MYPGRVTQVPHEDASNRHPRGLN